MQKIGNGSKYNRYEEWGLLPTRRAKPPSGRDSRVLSQNHTHRPHTPLLWQVNTSVICCLGTHRLHSLKVYEHVALGEEGAAASSPSSSSWHWLQPQEELDPSELQDASVALQILLASKFRKIRTVLFYCDSFCALSNSLSLRTDWDLRFLTRSPS